jgi:erythromycin esterase-like protein
VSTVEAGHGFDDLAPFDKVVGNARIVALGEATHGTREFFQLKHRLVEFLASRKGFTIFSIEANMPEAYRLNDFVLNGKGDPKQLLKGMYFWTWDTEEVLDMILWMRDFNRSGKGHIESTGFDMQTPTVSMEIVRAFVKQYDTSFLETLNRTYLDVARGFRSDVPSPGFGVATATFPVGLAAGKHIAFSGYIRTENITRGYAGLWWRVDGEPGQVLAFDNMQDREARGTAPWTRYQISLEVPQNAKNINFGVLHTGHGTAWFDSLRIEIDGTPYINPSQFDLDFESATAVGFHTGGRGYKVELDKTAAHSGSQSLRSKFVGDQLPPLPGNPIDKKLLPQACEQVLEHLETRRPELVNALNAQEVAWAIQNAQLVIQYVQFKTGQQTCDRCMADNVKWIADHNPAAKLILWAHNGHVSLQPTAMGSYLRAMFGSHFVNFGFAFNKGSFRAVEMGKGLREFSVGPAPQGSLDATLAAVGTPLFALDLRQAPSQGPVAEWLSRPHDTRSIGAIYGDSNPASWFFPMRARDAFDVILFVDQTSAARGSR